MLDVIKLAAVLFAIIYLLRRKVKIGHVMLICSALLAAFYLMSPGVILDTLRLTVTNPVTLKLLVALSMIRVLEMVLREHEILGEMMRASRDLFRSKRAVIASMPLLIGMLPSVGGAYFSAPMVEESTRGIRMSPEEKGFINYWFRHPWEFVLPLYPGILLASAISGIEVRTLMLANLAYAVLMVAGGFAFSMKQVGPGPKNRGVSRKGLLSFLPIGAVLVLVILVRLELYIAILIVSVGLLAFYRYGAKDILRVLKYGFSVDVIVLILGVMLFKGMMESSGAVDNLSGFLTSMGIPLMPMLFLLPFASGVLTGITIGFVGTAFPLLVSLSGGATTAAVTFAFASGFVGVLLSPVHVCLVLTKDYFKADMGGIYKRMLVPSALVLAAGALQYYLL
jgi:integral membrane protein (TIGR00529 family)